MSDNERHPCSTLEELVADAESAASPDLTADLQRLVAEQQETIESLRADAARREADREGSARSLEDARSRLKELESLVKGRGLEVERLQQELLDQNRVIANLRASVRSAEQAKGQAEAKLTAYHETAVELKRSYEERTLALEDLNGRLLRAESQSLEQAADSQKRAEQRADELNKSHFVLAQTFRDFHALQTVHFALKHEIERVEAAAKVEAQHHTELRRSLEDRVQALKSENQELIHLQKETAQHLSRLADHIAVHHPMRTSRFCRAVAYLGSLLKSPFVRGGSLRSARRSRSSPVASSDTSASSRRG